MPHTPEHIEEPQVQGGPEVVDFNKVFEDLYNEGLDFKVARRRLRRYEDGKSQFGALEEFYNNKKKSQDTQDQSGSDSSSGTDSTVSTSDTDQQTQVETGDSDSTAVGVPEYTPSIDVGEVPLPKSYQELAAAEVTTRSRPDAAYWEEDYINDFGEGEIYQLNVDKLFHDQTDRSLMASLNVIEIDAFDRWFNKWIQDDKNKRFFNAYLDTPAGEYLRMGLGTEFLTENYGYEKPEDQIEDLGMGIPLYNFKDMIYKMIASKQGLDSSGQLEFPGIVTKYMNNPGAFGVNKKEEKALMKDVEKDWGNFYRDMVKASLPYSVQQNEDDLKALEYYFKMGNDDLFDFNEDGEYGWQNWLGQTVLSSEYGGMMAVNKLAYWGSRTLGFFADIGTFLGIAPEGMGDMFREGLEPGLRAREKQMEQIRKKMNSYEEGISKSFGTWVNSGFTDTQALGNMFEQSFNMTVEAAPTIGLAVSVGVLTKSPTATALILTADGTAQRAMTIRNDITFDKFVPKEESDQLVRLQESVASLEKLKEKYDIEVDSEKIREVDNEIRNINGQIRELKKQEYSYYDAISQIEISPDDTMEDIQRKLEEKFVIKRDDGARGSYLMWTAATDFVADRVIFGIFSKALKGGKFDPLNATVNDAVKQALIGSGYAIPEAGIPTFISAYTDEFYRAKKTDSEFDSALAFEHALDATLGTAGIGPVMHTGGSSIAYHRAIGKRTVGPDGTSALSREAVEMMWDRSQDPNLNSQERAAALKMWHQFKSDQLVVETKNSDFFEYIGRQDPSALDDIANLDNRMLRLMKTFEDVKDPNAVMLMRQELAKLISDQQAIMNRFKEGFEAIYPHSTLRPKKVTPKVPDADPTVKIKETGEEETTSADKDALDQDVDKPKKADDTDAAPKDEAQEIIDLGRNNKILQFFRNTFRSDSGIGGKRGWNPFKRRTGKREVLAETIKGKSREMTAMEDQLLVDLNSIDALRSSVRFDDAGTKKVGRAEFKRRQAEIDRYLRGDEANIAFLNNDQRATLNYLRNRVDAQTSHLIALLKKNPTKKNLALIKTLEGNKGQYLRRSYEAFSDDGSWIKNLADPNRKGKYKQLYENAVEYVMVGGKKRQVGVSGRVVDENGVVVKEGEPVYSTEPISREKAELIVNDYIRDLNDRMFGAEPTMQAGGGLLGALDTNMLKGRKDIPEAFRKLLGEIEDTSFNYTNTMFRLGNYISDLTFQDSVRQQLLDIGLATTKDLAPTDFVSLEVGKAYSGLEGLYVSETFKNMFDSMKPLALPGGNMFNNIRRSIMKFQSRVKIGKTVLSPVTTIRNFISGIALSFNAGKFSFLNPKNWRNAAELAWGDATPGNTAIGKQRQMLIKEGVLKDGARAGDILNLLRAFNSETQAKNIAKNQKQKNRIDKRITNITQKLYAFGDDFYKVLAYYEEYNGLINSGMDDAAARTMAASRVRGGMPTYSYVPRNIKMLRGNIFAGTFVSFPYEVYRTTGNNYRYMMQDLAEGRTQMAMKRAIGMVMANGGVYALSKATMQQLGITEDVVDYMREVGYDFQENFLPIFMGKEDGIPSLFDAATLFPSEELMKPLRILFGEGDPEDETFQQRGLAAIQEMLDPFIAPELSASWFRQIFENKEDNTGKPIYYMDPDKDFATNIYENADDIIKWSLNNIGPGVYQTFREWARANEINPEWFGAHESVMKEYTEADILLSMLGARKQVFHPTMMTLGKIKGELNDLDSYEGFNITNNNLNLWVNKDLDFIEQRANEYVDKQMKIQERLLHLAEGPALLGASDTEIIDMFVRSGVSEQNANVLLQNALEGKPGYMTPVLLSAGRIENILKGIDDRNKGNRQKAEQEKAAAIETMELFNRFVNERWILLNEKNNEQEEN